MRQQHFGCVRRFHQEQGFLHATVGQNTYEDEVQRTLFLSGDATPDGRRGACFLVVPVDQEDLCDGRNEVDIRGWTEVWSEFLDEFKRCACFF